MRTFRFRAWDTENKCMRNNVAVGLGMVEYDLSCHQPVEIMIPMQFTGLKDRNGKEIYEGDLLADTGSDGNGGEIVYTLKEVVFHEGAFQMKELLDKEWGMEYMDDISHLEVIGNIYEHPNLLESEEK